MATRAVEVDESIARESLAAEKSETDSCSNLQDIAECAVCLQPCIHPVQLSCGHIFCYLCVKGTANQSKRCAMCRQEIPPDFLERPHLVHKEHLYKLVAFEDGNQWFYEGRNGWWQYDERTSTELETAYKRGDKNCELLIAGFLYKIDFESMVQMRRNDLSRKRRIKRDFANIPKKGVAGLRVTPQVTALGDCGNRETVDGEENELAAQVARSLDMDPLSESSKSSSNNMQQSSHNSRAESARSSPALPDHNYCNGGD